MSAETKPTSEPTFNYELIGALRPWEIEELADKVSGREIAQMFVEGLYKHLLKKINRRPKPADVEYIVRIAAETYEILGEHGDVVGDIGDSSIVWLVFVKAIGGASIVELEEIAANRVEQVDKAETSLQATTDVVKSYVLRQQIAPAELPRLIEKVHSVFVKNNKKTPFVKIKSGRLKKPTIREIEQSILPDALVSFIDGKYYKRLGPHIRKFGLSPVEYRRAYNLPSDYPMTADNLTKGKSVAVKTVYGAKTAAGTSRPRKQA